MKQYTVTFYDLIAYLVPGSCLNLILALLVSFLAGTSVFLDEFYALKWPWHLILSYISGHIIQAITTSIFAFDYNDWWINNNWNPSLKDRISNALNNKITGQSCSELVMDSMVINLAESMLVSNSHLEKSDIFRALQGFFRAMIGVYVLLAITSFLFFVYRTPLILPTIVTVQPISHYTMGIISILSLCAGYLTYKRYRQFGAYRLRTILFGIFASELEDAHKKDKDKDNAQSASSRSLKKTPDIDDSTD